MHTNTDNDSSLPRAVFAMPIVMGLVVTGSLAAPTPTPRAPHVQAHSAALIDADRDVFHDERAASLMTLDATDPMRAIRGAARWETIDPPRTREAAGEMLAAFTARGYTVDALRDDAGPAVPRVRVMRLPDMSALTLATDRRALFIKALIPLVLAENDRIERDRARLTAIAARDLAFDDLPAEDADFLRALAQHYDARPQDVAELLRRVDVIPVSIAIAQAAVESGWGTSYGARILHALFGQMAGARLREFPDLPSAVEAYVRNLNRHRAYARFRAARAQMRARGAIDALELTGQLTGYSELGEAYTRYLRGLIRENDLVRFDRVRLAG